METIGRRYDIDWLRVIAIGLLLIYHTAIAFQPWGIMIGFITNNESWESLWIPMKMLNVWRIPLLFYVAGMGVYFSLQNRNWKELILERSRRILLPFLFGWFVIVPLQTLLWLKAHHMPLSYVANPAHLWFLGNIFIYTIVFAALFIYLKSNANATLAVTIKKIFKTPFAIFLVIALLVSEAALVNPAIYEMYALTWHGFFLGMIAFLMGFCMVFTGQQFLQMIQKWKWAMLILAIGLYALRTLQNQLITPNYLLVPESVSWIMALFGFAHRHLNRPSAILAYLSKAAYPVYIVHMAVLYAGSILIFPLQLSVYLKFFLLVIFTVLISWLLYECIIKRVAFLRLFFGLAPK